MKTLFTVFLFFALAVPANCFAQAGFMTIDLAEKQVDITTGFHGTFLQIFGVREQPGDIVIIVEGPLRDMSVRQKEKIMGAWVNKNYQMFENVPSFYAYATSKPLEKMAPPQILDEHQIGLDHLKLKTETDVLDAEKLISFRKALIRNKQNQDLFAQHVENIVFLTPGFFRTQFYMPANVPVGEYTVKSFYLQEGMIMDVKTTTLKVAQIGLSAKVYQFAHRKRLLYGLVCITLALSAGWVSNRIRLVR